MKQGFKPPGNRVHEYHKNSKAFSVYRAAGDDPGAREYHDRAQCLAPWFIECETDHTPGGNAVSICGALLTIPLVSSWGLNSIACICLGRVLDYTVGLLCHRVVSILWGGVTAADSIDLEDDRWEVFYVFEEKTPREVLSEKWLPEAFVGYFTIFGFRNPVKGASLRICQALILPQFQRQGRVCRVQNIPASSFWNRLCILILI